MQVVSLGDLVLDVVVRVRSDVARGADTPARVALSAGGQGANVAAWVAALGASSRWIGKRADDAAGRLAAESLEDSRVQAGNRCRLVELTERFERRHLGPDELPPLQPRGSRDEREVVVRTPPVDAQRPPAADSAVVDGLGIGQRLLVR